MPSVGTVALVNVGADPSYKYRDFVEILPQSAFGIELQGTRISSFKIVEASPRGRWLAVAFRAESIDYRIEGQLVSPDALQPDTASIGFIARVVYKSTHFDNGPVPMDAAREALALISPVLKRAAAKAAHDAGLSGIPIG